MSPTAATTAVRGPAGCPGAGGAPGRAPPALAPGSLATAAGVIVAPAVARRPTVPDGANAAISDRRAPAPGASCARSDRGASSAPRLAAPPAVARHTR